MTGAYLYRLLARQRHEVDLYDLENGTRCGLTPCAWGTSGGFGPLVKASGLDPAKYISQRLTQVHMDDIPITAELMTINKPSLITDLLQGAEIHRVPLDPKMYDRVIDATGVARSLLPPIPNDIVLPCIQSMIHTSRALGNRIKLGGIGYAWCFPLGNNRYHIGCGSFIKDPRLIMAQLGWLGRDHSRPPFAFICSCSGRIRLTSPEYSQPFVSNNGDSEVWGVGEAIGCVAPLAGDGIVPGLRSAQHLVEHWDDPAAYRRAILRDMGWMTSERQVLNKLIEGRRLNILDAWVLKKNSRRMGIKIGIKSASLLMRNIR